VSIDDAEILVDGQPIGRSPLSEEVFVDPGPHAIEARLHGHEPARQVIEVEGGASVEVALSLAPIAVPEVPCPPDSPPPPPLPPPPPAVAVAGGDVPARRSTSKSPLAFYIGLSGVAFGVGVGLATLIYALIPAERPGRGGLGGRSSVTKGGASIGLLGRF
jgi:hypothetical protein